MMWLYLLDGDAVNLAVCPIRRLESTRAASAEHSTEVTAWFADGSTERLAVFTHERHTNMAIEFISLFVESQLDRMSRGIGALWLSDLIGQVESNYAEESTCAEETAEERIRSAA